jgi:N6-L-threonylcarbamoyladenine synthase
MQAHILAHFASDCPDGNPEFPFLCLTVSGGHTQLVLVHNPHTFQIIGQTIDDAVGEAFDKAAKILGLPYPGGPLIDKYAQGGNGSRFQFSDVRIPEFDFSFSGVKTSFLYFIKKEQNLDADFIKNNLPDICASYQSHLVNLLIKKTENALKETGIKHLAIAGGVSANSELRLRIRELGDKLNIKTYIPKTAYCTDNAAMIGVSGYFKFQAKQFSELSITPLTRQSQ